MPAASDSANVAEKTRTSRQRAGPACAECRRRKLRCDGVEPNCGTCSDLGIHCQQTQFNTPRGPKKGYMKALQSRMATLEAKLQEQIEANNSVPTTMPQTTTNLADLSLGDMSLPDMSLQCELPSLTPVNQFPTQLPTPPRTNSTVSVPTLAQDMSMEMDMNFNFDMNMLPSMDYNIDPVITDVVQADLDQIYFERAHSFAPILQRRRYLNWANQPNKTEAQKALQYAIWTLASVFSTQLEYLRPTLHAAVLRILDDLERTETEPCMIETEHAQARVLLLVHDLLKTNFDLAWLGAAKCFRLLQYIHLHEIDSPQQTTKRAAVNGQEDKVQTEELRRTLWCAYTIDCFINLRSGRSLTFLETAISVRLPVSEDQFQSGRCSRQPLLADVMNSCSDQSFCPLAECIVIATLVNRTHMHAQQSNLELVSSRATSQVWNRHFWIEEALRARCLVLDLHTSEDMHDADGLLMFAKMAAQCVMLHLCKVLEAKAFITPDDKDAVSQVKERTGQAAQELAMLSIHLQHASCFKIHPFTPLCIGWCADFLKDRHTDFGLNELDIRQIVQPLSEMSSMNRLADDAYQQIVMPSPAPSNFSRSLSVGSSILL